MSGSSAPDSSPSVESYTCPDCGHGWQFHTEHITVVGRASKPGDAIPCMHTSDTEFDAWCGCTSHAPRFHSMSVTPPP